MTNLPVQTINNYHFTDYEQPIVITKPDARTSYYRAHRNYLTNELIPPSNDRIGTDTSIVLFDAARQQKRIRESETNDQFKWKHPITDKYEQQANLPMSCRKPQFLQTMQERLFRNPPQPIKNDTINNLTYTNKNFDVKPSLAIADNNAKFCSPPVRSQKNIYTYSQGFHKHLDPYATTNMMTHIPFTAEQQCGIASKDNLTIWDWIEAPKSIKGFGLSIYPVKQKQMKEPTISDRRQFKSDVRDSLLPRKLQFVPNNGLKSEKQDNYQIPNIELNANPDIYDIQPLALPPTGLTTGTTEYTMYNSGKRIDSVIDQTFVNT